MKRRYKLLNALGKTIALTWKLLDYWYVLLIYAGLLTCVSLIFKRWSYSCLTEQLPSWCYTFSDNPVGLIAYFVAYYTCVCTVIFSFGYDIYKAAFKQEPFKIKDIFCFDKPKLKTIGMSFCSIFALIFPIALAVYLINRPAVPIFEIELIFFTIVFSCALLSVLFIRLSSFIGYYMNDGRMPSLIKLFHRTSGKAYVALVSFLVILLIMCISQIRLIGALTNFNEHDLFYTTVVSEYFDYAVKLFFFGLFLASFRAQYELFKQEDDELAVADVSAVEQKDSEESVTDIKFVQEEINKTKKAKSKKTSAKKALSKKTANTRKSPAKKTKK